MADARSRFIAFSCENGVDCSIEGLRTTWNNAGMMQKVRRGAGFSVLGAKLAAQHGAGSGGGAGAAPFGGASGGLSSRTNDKQGCGGSTCAGSVSSDVRGCVIVRGRGGGNDGQGRIESNRARGLNDTQGANDAQRGVELNRVGDGGGDRWDAEAPPYFRRRAAEIWWRALIGGGCSSGRRRHFDKAKAATPGGAALRQGEGGSCGRGWPSGGRETAGRGSGGGGRAA